MFIYLHIRDCYNKADEYNQLGLVVAVILYTSSDTSAPVATSLEISSFSNLTSSSRMVLEDTCQAWKLNPRSE